MDWTGLFSSERLNREKGELLKTQTVKRQREINNHAQIMWKLNTFLKNYKFFFNNFAMNGFIAGDVMKQSKTTE